MLIRRGLPRPDWIRGQDPAAPDAPPSGRVVTIGSFDGLHLGHQSLIQSTLRSARELGQTSALVSFHPHPRAYFQPAAAPGLILPFRDRLSQLKAWGVDEAILLPFNRHLSGMSAEEFVEGILVRGLATRHLIIGEGFRFGHGRRGDAALLQAMGQSLGFTVDCLPSCLVAGERASSSRLRDALRGGHLALAEALLGRPYCLSGRVSHGQKLGRQLGFPTLNLRMPDRLVASGVFAVSVRGLHGRLGEGPVAYGVASLGRRPTVESEGRLLLEVHLFDWAGDAYGRQVEVRLHHFLRHEAHYATLEAMLDQIQIDAAQARALLLSSPAPH